VLIKTPPKWKRFLSTCDLFKKFCDQPQPFSVIQTRSGHHGTSGVTAGALKVIESKSATERVFPPAMANVVGKGVRPSHVMVRRKEKTILHILLVFLTQ